MKELPGILNWALIGLKRLKDQGHEFSKSVVIDNAINRYKQDQNPILNYMTEMLNKAGPTDRVSKAQIMDGYYVWCRRNGLGDSIKTSPQKFWNTFRSNSNELGLPYDVQLSNGVRYLKKLTLRDTDGACMNDIFGYINEDVLV